MNLLLLLLFLLLLTLGVELRAAGGAAGGAAGRSTMKPPSLDPVFWQDVVIHDAFWRPRQEAIMTAGLTHLIDVCENQHAYVRNLVEAGKKNQGLSHNPYEGFFWDDYFLHKCVEDIAYSLSLDAMGNPDVAAAQKTQRAKLQQWIPIYQAAQEQSGYFDTYFTLTGEEKFKGSRVKHELFLMGTLLEAGLVHARLTQGEDRRLLDVAIRCADYLCDTIGPSGQADKPGLKLSAGHPGIEFALIELAQWLSTTEAPDAGARYIALAKTLIDTKGDHEDRYDLESSRDRAKRAYFLDHEPLVQQDRATGHAVRANYLYTAATDMARLTGDESYRAAVDRLCDNAVQRHMYITGGMGLRRGEAYQKDYNIPRQGRAVYQESCATISNVMWQHRMMLLHRDARYIDVMERALYNGVLAGISLSGDRYFYVNPLESRGLERWAWHNCACCPGNLTRTILRMGDYVYALGEDAIYLNLFVDSQSTLSAGGQDVELIQATRYPWDGEVTVTVNPAAPARFAMHIRIPGWSQNSPVPGGLYRYLDASDEAVTLRVNGKVVAMQLEKGYAVLTRRWKAGDTITLHLPMPVRRAVSHEKVVASAGHVAIERGPIVYCAERLDQPGTLRTTSLSDATRLESHHRQDLLGGVTVVTTCESGASGASGVKDPLTLIPYYAWANRGKSPMKVWFPRDDA